MKIRVEIPHFFYLTWMILSNTVRPGQTKRFERLPIVSNFYFFLFLKLGFYICLTIVF